MRLWAKASLIMIPGLAAAHWLARCYRSRAVAAAVEAIETHARQQNPQQLATQSLGRLPTPVVRYLNHALPPDRRGLKLARYEQAGVLRTDASKDSWVEFTASQVISPTTMEFLWKARVAIVPFLHVQVTDSLVGGRGAGRVTLLSAIPVSSAAGNVEMNSGSMHRFLAEAVWYPSALLPSAHLTWTPVDDSRALATLTDGATTVSLEFRFNSENEVTSIYTPGRWGFFEGGYKQVAWEGKFRKYSRRQGVLVPSQGEVGWYLDGEWRSVWRGTIISASLDFL